MLIGIHVTTSAKQERVERVSESRYEVMLREPAERGIANRRLLELMREHHPATIIRIVSGHHSPTKIISIEKKS